MGASSLSLTGVVIPGTSILHRQMRLKKRKTFHIQLVTWCRIIRIVPTICKVSSTAKLKTFPPFLELQRQQYNFATLFPLLHIVISASLFEMVRRSKGCATCKQRKIKVDELPGNCRLDTHRCRPTIVWRITAQLLEMWTVWAWLSRPTYGSARAQPADQACVSSI